MWLRDRLVPALAGLAVLAVAVVVVVLLRSAADDGTQALEDAKVAQVRTTATSFNDRVDSSIQSLAGLGARPWELTLKSKADKETLDTFAIDPEAESGSFLVDADGTITNGTLLRPDMLGSTYDAPGWTEALEELANTPAIVLPVAPTGVTTELPTYAFAVAIRGEDATSVRGAFIFEAALTERLGVQPGDRRPGRRLRLDRRLALPGQQRRGRGDDAGQRSRRTGERHEARRPEPGPAPGRRRHGRQRRRAQRGLDGDLHPEP